MYIYIYIYIYTYICIGRRISKAGRTVKPKLAKRSNGQNETERTVEHPPVVWSKRNRTNGQNRTNPPVLVERSNDIFRGLGATPGLK